ncbi:MAG TPA: hypothetical protein VHP11_10445 [Tepidisphaeraceae bacterium]|nr:hypothetical protein [Tepidisphaeraceae bacterium]
MFRRNLAVLSVVGALFMVAATGYVLAQDAGGGRQGGPGAPGGPGGRFDPQQFRQRMFDRMKEQLGATDDEWKVLQPKIEKVMSAQREGRGAGGMMGFMGGMGGNRRPGGDRPGADRPSADRQPETAVGKANQDLRAALENKDTSADEIAKKLQALRDAREQAKQNLLTAQKELKELLSQRQEATLVMSGMLD